MYNVSLLVSSAIALAVVYLLGFFVSPVFFLLAFPAFFTMAYLDQIGALPHYKVQITKVDSWWNFTAVVASIVVVLVVAMMMLGGIFSLLAGVPNS